MVRRSTFAALLTFVLLAGLVPMAVAGAEPPPLPASIAAVGDSISQAASTGGSLGADYPANSWSTGTNTTVNSHYLRLLGLNPAISGRARNDSVSGAKMAGLDSQMGAVVARSQKPDYLTVLIGGNDLCTDTVAQMTSEADFRVQFVTAMETLRAGSPGTDVYVVSIPNAYQLWDLFRTSWWARTVWNAGDICQSLLANPTSTQSADVSRRAQVAARNVAYNMILADVCADDARCRFDGNAVYNTAFVRSDVSGDYFHPSLAGQAKLSAVSWAAGYWPNGGPAPDAAPTASFTATCADLVCTFNGSGSTDDKGITSYAWDFGDGSTASGVSIQHEYASTGSYDVRLEVVDTIGQTATRTTSVSVTAPSTGGTVQLASATGAPTPRKGGWTAAVTVSVVDAGGTAVGGSAVSGTWSSGTSGGCTTADSGACSFTLAVNRKTQSVTWMVTGISADGYTYVAGPVTGVTIVAP